MLFCWQDIDICCFTLVSPAGSSGSQKLSGGETSSQPLKESIDSQFRISQGASSSGMVRKEAFEEKRHTTVSNAASRVQAGKANSSQPHSAVVASSSSTIGVYFSSTDPVHVPSPDSRSSAAVGAIRREVGVVGVRRQSIDNSKSSIPSGSLSNSLLAGDGSTESFRSFTTVSKNDQLSQTSESVMPGMPVSKSFLGSQYNSRPHQQPVGHLKGIINPKTNCLLRNINNLK